MNMSCANSEYSEEEYLSMEEWDLCDSNSEKDITNLMSSNTNGLEGDLSEPGSSASSTKGGDVVDTSDSEGEEERESEQYIIDEILRQNCRDRQFEMDGFMVFMEEVDRNIAEIQGAVIQYVDSFLLAVNNFKTWAFG